MANIFDSLKQVAQLRQQAAEFQRILASKIVEAASPAGEVKIKVNGKMELLSIEIDPCVLSPEHKSRVEKLILRTWASAQKEVERVLGAELKAKVGGLPF